MEKMTELPHAVFFFFTVNNAGPEMGERLDKEKGKCRKTEQTRAYRNTCERAGLPWAGI